ncbi:MAG: TIGR03435 family protein [Acidobacteriaceae bacterium]|nr:TIGR03435 family protein [Acidobacteriaceae bacterium]
MNPIAVVVLAAFLLLGRAQQIDKPEFEVASIKPNKSAAVGARVMMQPGGRLVATGINVRFLLEMAYDAKDSQVVDAPSWFDSERYDIDAKADENTASALTKLPRDQGMDIMRKMVQGLLADRFKLQLGHETKELPVYELVVAKGGPKFHESTFKPPPLAPDGAPPPPPGPGARPRQGIMMNGRGEVTVAYGDMPMFVNVLSHIVGRVVVDKTGLAGKYDFTLKWTPDESQGMMGPPGAGPGPGGAAPPPADPSGPSIFTALQEQLGLKLDSQKAPTDVLVIQHVERPSEN